MSGLEDLVDQLRLAGVEVVWAHRLACPGYAFATERLLILHAGRPVEQLEGLCRSALSETVAQTPIASAPRHVPTPYVRSTPLTPHERSLELQVAVEQLRALIGGHGADGVPLERSPTRALPLPGRRRRGGAADDPQAPSRARVA